MPPGPGNSCTDTDGTQGVTKPHPPVHLPPFPHADSARRPLLTLAIGLLGFGLAADLSAQCDAEGGAIAFADGTTSQTIVVDGTPDPLDVTLDGTAAGANAAWVITDADANILALPPAPPFDLDGAGVGTCLIWYLRFEDGLQGAAVGNNAAADLVGCFDLSNPLTVERVGDTGAAVSTGDISMPSGATTRYVCPGNDGDIAVQLNYATPGGRVAYAVTDGDFDIIGIQDEPTVNAAAAPPGTCYIFAFNYTGTITGQVGDRVYDTRFSDDAWLISNNAIRVVREAPEGGTIAAKDGSTTLYTCIDGRDDFVGFEPAGVGRANYTYVITDADNVILGLNTRGFQNFEGAGVGDCRVWGLSYTGVITAQPGDNAAEVALTDRCFDLSDNFITVVRQDVDGGTVLSGGSERAAATASNPTVDYEGTTASGAAYAYFVLDGAQRVAAITFGESFDFSTLPAGGGDTYYVYGVSHNGTVLLGVGDEFWGRAITDGCFEISGNALVVDYDRSARPFGFAVAPSDGATALTISLDAASVAALGRDGAADAPALVRVVDAYGRTVAQRRVGRTSDLRAYRLALPGARGGLHFVSVARGGHVVTERALLEPR